MYLCMVKVLKTSALCLMTILLLIQQIWMLPSWNGDASPGVERGHECTISPGTGFMQQLMAHESERIQRVQGSFLQKLIRTPVLPEFTATLISLSETACPRPAALAEQFLIIVLPLESFSIPFPFHYFW